MGNLPKVTQSELGSRSCPRSVPSPFWDQAGAVSCGEEEEVSDLHAARARKPGGHRVPTTLEPAEARPGELKPGAAAGLGRQPPQWGPGRRALPLPARQRPVAARQALSDVRV